VFIVNQGDNSCLTGSSPSSTPGSPAGGAYPTSTSGAGTGGGGGGGGSANIGAIVGGVIGGIVFLVALALVLLFFYRRQKFHATQQSRPLDIFGHDEDDQPEMSQQLPSYYQPEPFVVPDPTIISSEGDDSHSQTHSNRPPSSSAGLIGAGGAPGERERRYSRLSLTTRSQTPDPSNLGSATGTSTYMRKSAAPPSFRPVNIVQHEDAGPPEQEGGRAEEPVETIELPPAYTNLKTASGVHVPLTPPADSAVQAGGEDGATAGAGRDIEEV